MRILVCVKRVPLDRRRRSCSPPTSRRSRPATSASRSARTRSAASRRRSGSSSSTAARSTVLTLGPGRGRGAAARRAGDRRRPRRPARDRRRGLGPAGHRRGDRRRDRAPRRPRTVRPDPLRQRVGRLGQLPGRHPRRARARPAGRDRAEGPRGRRRPRALRAGGGRRARRLRAAAAGRGDRARGINLPRYPSVPGRSCARARSRSSSARPSVRRRGSRSCGWWCRRDRASRPRCSATGPTRRRRWSRCMRELGVA